jgi:hypothetical protein
VGAAKSNVCIPVAVFTNGGGSTHTSKNNREEHGRT